MARSTTLRRAGILVFAGMLVAAPGCASLLGSGPSGGNTTTTQTTPATTAATTTATSTTTSTSTSTTTTSTTTSTTATTTSDGHSHDHNQTTTTDDVSENVVYGEIGVAIAGDRVDISGEGSREAGVWFEAPAGWRRNASADVTLAEALAQLGIEATADTLRYDGETYRESAEGVGLYYRVDGEPVDPTEYVLQSGDQVWVTVETPNMDVQVPGNHIDHETLHIHGSIDFVVDGHTVDFGREKYQVAGHSRYFHFEGGEAEPWHAHSYAVTLEYAMATLQGISVSEDSVTYNGTTYNESDPGTTVKILVNGEPVDPSEYYLKDGDHVRIVVETDESADVAVEFESESDS